MLTGTKTQIMVYKGVEINRDSSLVPDPSTRTALSQPLQTPGPQGAMERPEAEGGALLCYSKKGLQWESSSCSHSLRLVSHLQIRT